MIYFFKLFFYLLRQPHDRGKKILDQDFEDYHQRKSELCAELGSVNKEVAAMEAPASGMFKFTFAAESVNRAEGEARTMFEQYRRIMAIIDAKDKAAKKNSA